MNLLHRNSKATSYDQLNFCNCKFYFYFLWFSYFCGFSFITYTFIYMYRNRNCGINNAPQTCYGRSVARLFVQIIFILSDGSFCVAEWCNDEKHIFFSCHEVKWKQGSNYFVCIWSTKILRIFGKVLVLPLKQHAVMLGNIPPSKYTTHTGQTVHAITAWMDFTFTHFNLLIGKHYITFGKGREWFDQKHLFPWQHIWRKEQVLLLAFCTVSNTKFYILIYNCSCNENVMCGKAIASYKSQFLNK